MKAPARSVVGLAGLKVLHVVPSYYPAVRYGGPIVSVRSLCEALVRAGARVDVATTDSDGPYDLDVPTDGWEELGGVRIRYFRRWPRTNIASSLPLARFLMKGIGQYDLVHIVGGFSFPSLVAGIAAREAGVPYVVSTRGIVQPWSLTQKRWKKLPYWRLVERRSLERAATIHATSYAEADAIKQLLPKAHVFIAPNGVDVLTPPRVARNPKQVVFLGRLHKVKGLEILIEALALVAEALPEVETVIAGPDSEGEWARLERQISTSTPRPRIRYAGEVSGDDKWRLLASSAALALPSHSENFGIAVVEALACGTPVVVSRNCPWRSVEERGAGFWVENTPQKLAAALISILADPAAASRMGAAAVRLAGEYSWPKLGADMLAEYGRILKVTRR